MFICVANLQYSSVIYVQVFSLTLVANVSLSLGIAHLKELTASDCSSTPLQRVCMCARREVPRRAEHQTLLALGSADSS